MTVGSLRQCDATADFLDACLIAATLSFGYSSIAFIRV